MSTADLPLVMSVNQVADLAGVSTKTVYRRPKDFGGKKIRGKGNWKFARDTVLAILGFPPVAS